MSARLDYHTDEHNAFLRYSHEGNIRFAPRYVGSMPSAWPNNTNWADSGVFSLISTFTPSLVNEFRYSNTFWSNRYTLPTAQQCPDCPGLDGPHVDMDGTTLAFGNETNTPQSRILRRNIFDDNMTVQKGAHHMKLGGEWELDHGTGTYKGRDGPLRCCRNYAPTAQRSTKRSSRLKDSQAALEEALADRENG